MSQFVQHQIEAQEFYREVIAEATSHEPGSIGQLLRIEAINSEADEIIRMVRDEQLWGEQIDMYSRKLPEYRPDTIRKKAKIGHPANKLVNYTENWSGAFYEEGLEVQIFADTDSYGIGRTDRRDYFQYIPDEYIGLTEDNKARLLEVLNRVAREAQLNYIYQRINGSPYADILNIEMYFGHDFSV